MMASRLVRDSGRPAAGSGSRCRAAPSSTAPSTCSTAIGVDTAELRGDSRSLVFETERAAAW